MTRSPEFGPDCEGRRAKVYLNGERVCDLPRFGGLTRIHFGAADRILDQEHTCELSPLMHDTIEYFNIVTADRIEKIGKVTLEYVE